jgi:hypothetical protein
MIAMMISFSSFAQNKDVTKFLGIPVDGTKTEMKQKLIAKGFVPKKMGDLEWLEGEFNGRNVNVYICTNWNFGANISTGDEGFNNAEYEGILSGKLLNNRLLFNGQFGYRDNPNATQSFIGDFDLRYLIFPNGNLAIRMYNQTNDRYFTRNSLNTQGLGLIMKKDFNGLRDFFGIKKKKKKKK